MMIKDFQNRNTLYVFALPQEAGSLFENDRTLFTGVGKVNASYALMKYLAANDVDLIVNLGSAGSALHTKASLINCTQFVQRDMDVTALGFEKYKTPFSNEPPVLAHGIAIDGLKQGICGSGDSFDTAHDGTFYDVVDMEAYALALIAQRERIPFLCLKYVTDGADGKAANDWQESVHLAAAAFKSALQY